MNSPQTRRQFIGTTGIATAGIGLGLALGPRGFAQSKDAKDKIVFGLIGCGGMGRANMNRFLSIGGSEIAAVCDVDEKHMDAAVADVVKAGRPAPKKIKDFRRLLDEKVVNAVIIGTPDHWHAIPFIAACEAGKDIYCEKPISQSFVEAKAMMNAAKHFKTVVQVGTWQRSMKHFQDAIDFVRSGKMGEISLCRSWIVQSADKPTSNIGKQSPQAAPPELDWDFWLGPAPKVGYQPNRCHQNWRWFYDYGGGLMTDWGVHMMDIGFLALQNTDPISISAAGGIFTTDDDRTTPDTLLATYNFPKHLMTWEHRFNNGRGLDGGDSHGTEFIGTNGTLIVDRSGYKYFPEKKENETPPESKRIDSTHWQNFLDCVKTRQTPRSGIESMAKTTMLCHLGNIAFESGKTLLWNAKKQDVENHSDVKNCISYERDYRKPWKLKLYKA